MIMIIITIIIMWTQVPFLSLCFLGPFGIEPLSGISDLGLLSFKSLWLRKAKHLGSATEKMGVFPTSHYAIEVHTEETETKGPTPC